MRTRRRKKSSIRRKKIRGKKM